MSNANDTAVQLEDLVSSTVSIPTIPSTLLELKEVCANDRSDAEDIAAVIEKDPAVAAKVLRLVNSSFYALAHPVNAIPIACTIIGRRVVQNLVLQATVLTQFESDDEGVGMFDQDLLWDHSFKAAVAMQQLTQKSALNIGLTRDDAYTCGLMHDVGKILLHQSMPEQFAEAMLQSAKLGLPLAESERQQFGFTHADAGALLARKWKLSDELSAAIQHHHDASTETPEQTLGMFVHVASSLAHEASAAQPSWTPHSASPESIASLRIETGALDEILTLVSQTKLD